MITSDQEAFAAPADDLSTFIQNHPDRFDIRFFKAKTELPERDLVLFPSISFYGARPVFRIAIITKEEITGIDASVKRAMEWEGAIVTQAVSVRKIEDNQPITLMIDAGEVPRGSVIEIVALLKRGYIRWATYIVTEICGDAPGGHIYTCVPANDLCEGGFAFIEQPFHVAPADREANVSLAPALSAWLFCCHGRNVTHVFSQWQVWKEGETDNEPVFDEVTVLGDVRSCSIPKGVLEQRQTYLWHVRYGGAGEDPEISEFSTPTSFTTAESFE